jgi:hypothetical protein
MEWTTPALVDSARLYQSHSLSHYYRLPSHSRVAPRSGNHMLAARESRTACTIYPGAPSDASPDDVSPPRATRCRVYGPPVDTWIGGPTVQWTCDTVGVAVSGVCIRSGRGMAREAVTDRWARTSRRRIYVLCLGLVTVGIMTILPLSFM